MKYLITSIKEIEDILTPSLVEYDDDLPFNSFAFSRFEKQFRSCMELSRIETFGEDFEKFPIKFEEFNLKYDKFNGMNFDLLNQIIEIEEFKVDLIKHLKSCEDSLVNDIARQLPNPSEAEFKMFLNDTLKALKSSYEFLFSLEFNNNAILNLVKNELIESHKRAFGKAKNYFSVYEEILRSNVLDDENLNQVNVASENDLYNNPYPRIFSDIESFLFCEELIKNICNVKRTRLADCSFVFRMMQKDGYIFDDVSEGSFRNFLSKNYEFTFDKLKTYEYSYTDKKIQLYNSLKK